MYDVYKIPLEKLYNRKCRIHTIKGDNSKKKTNDNSFYRKEGIYYKPIVLFYVHFAFSCIISACSMNAFFSFVLLMVNIP